MNAVSLAAVEVAWKGSALTGECPVWDERTHRLLWTDIEGRRLHALDTRTGAHAAWETTARVGCFALARDNNLVAAAEGDFVWLSPRGESLDVIASPEADLAGNRFNDGGCDRQGRFLAGSMNLARDAASGAWWSLSPGGVPRRIGDGVTVANGLAFSPDGTRMYRADSPRERVFVCDYDPASGEASRPRLWLDAGHAPGRPDGGAVDADGCYWSARWRGGCVVRFTPAGRVDRVVELPVSQVTMAAFGGDDFGTMFVTSARNRLDAAALAREPLAGSVFAVAAGVTGLPAVRFEGTYQRRNP